MNGFCVLEDCVPVDGHLGEIPVPWWSFAKTVLAAAALRLVEMGHLSLEEPLEGGGYCLRQLLQHRAGLPDYGELAAYHQAVARGDEPWPVEALLERLDTHRLRYEPDRGWAYSNVGYWMVRRLIERSCDEPLGSALNRLVFEPLGVANVHLPKFRVLLMASRWVTPARITRVGYITASSSALWHPLRYCFTASCWAIYYLRPF